MAIDTGETEKYIMALEKLKDRDGITAADCAIDYIRALQQRVTELEQTARDYDTLRENHTELQREYRALEEAVAWAPAERTELPGGDGPNKPLERRIGALERDVAALKTRVGPRRYR